MTAETYLWIGLVISIGAMIQGAVGFAFGIFSIPLLVWLGIPLERAIAVILTLVSVQTLSVGWRYRAEVPWREVLTVSAYRFLALPVGIGLLVLANRNLTHGEIKQCVGLMLLVVMAIQWMVRPLPGPTVPHVWCAIAGLTSGCLAGVVGMGGPPVVLWAMAHDWSTIRARMCLWTMFLLMAPWQLALQIREFGPSITTAILLGLAFSPMVILATLVGARIGNHFSRQRLRSIVYGILIVLGVTSIVQPMLG